MSLWTAPIIVLFITIVYFFRRPTKVSMKKESPGPYDHASEQSTEDSSAKSPPGADPSSEQTTPKAHHTAVPALDIPALSLEAPASADQATRSMPPPPVPMLVSRPAPSAAANRLSPAAQARQSPAPTASTMNNARGKVMLSPGHSPLDWAQLTRSANLSGVSGLERVTPSMLKAHNGRKGMPAWSSYMGKVYNIGPYLPFHPGGQDQLRRASGIDGARLFHEAHSWVNWENMMSSCVVGILVSERGLDDLD